MIRTINPDAQIEYVCQADRGSAQETVFILGTIDARVRSHINDRVASLDGPGKQAEQLIRAGSWRWLTCKYGIKGWRNLADHEGKPIAERFDQMPHGAKSYRAVSDAVLSLLPENILYELAGEISKLNTMSEEEQRPLASPSS